MTENAYPPGYTETLESWWGDGFLSPGGPGEVLEILRDIDVRGKRVLDIGCGTGGPAMVIAREMDPLRVTGIDIEPYPVEKGLQNVRAAALGHLVELKLVEPGALPFADATFDIVFSKDSLIHVADKSSLYREVCRVLQPGGEFAASDWLRSEDADELAGYRAWRISSSHDFAMQTLAQTLSEMADAGLVDLRSRDRSEWYCKTAAETVKMMRETGWREQFIRSFGRALYEQKLAHRQANARAATCGGLRPTHIFGSKPDQD